MHRIAAFLALGVLAAVATAQNTVVIPAGTATAEGNSSNAFPWGRGGLGMRIQNVYDSSHFTSQGITTPVMITRLRWRMDSGTARTWVNSAYQNATISLSTSPLDQALVSTNFASNQGADLTTVFTGPVAWPAGATTTPGPAPFLIDVPFTTPFFYNPAAGDLNIETDLPIQTFTGTAVQLDVQTTSSLASRVYLSTGYPVGAGTIGLNHGVVVEVTHAPAVGLFPRFLATPTSGASPLNVQFTDLSYSSDPAGVLAWQWDLDGDGIVDSTLQNPSFTYTGCGSYNVSLTVLDAASPPQTFTVPNYITTDTLVVSFTKTSLGGGAFQFNDTSVLTPQTWAWDLDGDSVIDSTLQNPTWTYPVDCSATNVTLTATLNCRAGTAAEQVFVAPASFASTPTTNNGNASASWVGNMFDMVVTSPEGISVCGVTVKPYTFAGPVNCQVYVTPDTYLGKNGNAALWRLVGSGAAVTHGGTFSAPSLVDVAMQTPFYLPAGNYGVAVYINNPAGTANLAYTNAPVGPFVGTDITFTPVPATAPGVASLALFSASTTANRAWSGGFHYTTVSLTNTGGYGFFGAGCAGTLAISNLAVNAAPALGQTLAVTANHLPLDAAIGMIGFSNTSSLFGPLPFDLTGIGAPGCFGRVSPNAYAVLIGAGGAATWNLPLPNAPALLGARAYQQALVLDTGINALGIVTSDAAGFVIGL